MKLSSSIALAAVTVLALVVSSPTLASGGVAGTYSTTLKSPASLKGKWVLALAKDGTYRVALNGRALARGTYTASAATITLREPDGCGGTGTYAWKRSGTTMSFTRKREAPSCQARAAVLARPLTQVRGAS
jgi:hypothetical protein